MYPHKMTVRQRFKLRATIIGEGVWVCPDCGHTQKLKISPKFRWRVRCTNRECSHNFRVGLVFHRQRQRDHVRRPHDTIIGESIPESILSPEPYQVRDPVHRVVDEAGAEDSVEVPGLLEDTG